MKTTALKSASAAFLAGLLVLGVVVATTYVNTNVLIETANRATLSHEVLESVTLLRLQAMAIESSIRGYAITGDPRSLALYRESLEEIPPHLVRLKGLTADNRDQQRALIDLDPLLNQLILASKGVIEARDQFGAGAALDLVRSPHSEELMESIRQVLGKMENRETILLQARSLGSRESARKTTFIVVLAGILTLAIAAGAGDALYREFVQRDRRNQRKGIVGIKLNEELL